MKTYKNIENLAGMLKLARRSANLSQVELGKKLKTKQSSISRAEKGDVTSIRFAEKWVNACGYSLRFNHISIENEIEGYSSFTAQS